MPNRMAVFAIALGAVAVAAVLAFGVTKLAILPVLAVIDLLVALLHWFGIAVSL
jgi:hypothetical protein